MLDKKISSDLHTHVLKTVVENLSKKGITVSFETTEKVCKSEWEFLTYVMRFGENESLRLQYLGNMGVKSYREAFSARRYLTTEEFYEFIKLPKEETLAYLQSKYDAYKAKWDHMRHINRKVLVFKNDKFITECKLIEASELTKIPPIFIFISCCKGTKTRNNYTFKFEKIDSEEISEEDQNNR